MRKLYRHLTCTIFSRADQRKWRELIDNLRERIQEAINTMGCDCGQRHKRYAVEERSMLEVVYIKIPSFLTQHYSQARYCSKCGERHMAREGDIWAESRYCGFLWYYYCLINGVVYDITEWAACEVGIVLLERYLQTVNALAA